MAVVGHIVKAPVETYPVGIDYTSAAPEGATLSSGTWTATDITTETDATNSVLISQTAVISGQVAKCRVLAGLVNHEYRIEVEVTFNTADVLRDHFSMHIRSDG